MKTGRSRRQRGAALLTAILIASLISALAASMIWQQRRAIRLAEAERVRATATWVLRGTLDWARSNLEEDARTRQADKAIDHIGQTWAVPMVEARLATFLSVDGAVVGDDDPEAFVSSTVVDAQSRYDLMRLTVSDGEMALAELAILVRLCQTAGVESDVAKTIADGLRGAAAQDAAAPLRPQTLQQLTWFGVAPAAVAALAPYVTLLPVPEPVNVNTAPREVLAALVEGMDLSTADRLVQLREHEPFITAQAFADQIPELAVSLDRISVSTEFFEVRSRLRLSDRLIEQRTLLQRSADGRMNVVRVEPNAAQG